MGMKRILGVSFADDGAYQLSRFRLVTRVRRLVVLQRNEQSQVDVHRQDRKKGCHDSTEGQVLEYMKKLII